MSEAEEDVMSDSVIEFDDEFDDFDPLAESGDDRPDAGDDRPDAEDADGDDEDADGEGKEDGDDGEDVVADVGTPGAPARPAARRPRKREPAAARQAAQTVGTRRIIVVAPEERQSSNVMTLAEATRAIALRAKQISTHPYAYTDVEDLTDAISIARKEFFNRRSPLNLERRMGRTPAGESIIEVWAVREMSYPPLN
jgi:DNA-directed RNA polymerase subunit K/omega